MPKFYMLVGVAGTGKSTWAKEHLESGLYDRILSSDEYRERLFGDVADQTHNEEVFKALNTDLKQLLTDGVSVCYDATNINMKDRAKALDCIKKIPNVTKIAVVLVTPIQNVYAQNLKRDNSVPAFVVTKHLSKFEVPIKGEGFDEIQLVRIKNDVSVPLHIAQALMDGVDQCNPHHTLNLGDHCRKCSELITETGLDNDKDLYVASLIHDFGKLVTKSVDEGGVAHYYNHENLGAYKSLLLDYSSDVDPLKVAMYINYHMLPFQLKRASESKIEKYKRIFGEDVWNKIQELHKADEGAV